MPSMISIPSMKSITSVSLPPASSVAEPQSAPPTLQVSRVHCLCICFIPKASWAGIHILQPHPTSPVLSGYRPHGHISTFVQTNTKPSLLEFC